MTVLRSLLFVPGNQDRMLERARGHKPDAFIPDLEDSVPYHEKAHAREVTASFLPRLAQVGPLVIPRVNALETGFCESDLAAVVGPHIDAVSVGKIYTPKDVRTLSEMIEALEKKSGIPVGKVKLILWIETAMAIVHCYEICVSSPRILAVAFGAEDLTNDMGIERAEDDSEVMVPRSLICIAARAADILALDTPYFGFRDSEGLIRNATASKKMGFKGKFAIHPAQIEPINTVFSPSPVEIEHAQQVVAAFEEAERTGRGSTSLDGKVVDVPVVKRAQALLELAARMQQNA